MGFISGKVAQLNNREDDMNKWPNYEVVSKIWNGDRCIIIVQCKTKHDLVASAKATVTGRDDETTKQVEAETLRIAVRNLSYGVESVEAPYN